MANINKIAAQSPETYSPDNFVQGIATVIKNDAAAGMSFVDGIKAQVKSCNLPALSPERYSAEIGPIFKATIAERTGLAENSAKIYASVVKPMVIALSNGFILPVEATSKNAASKACVAFMRAKGWGSDKGRKAGGAVAGKAGDGTGASVSAAPQEDITIADIAELLFPDNPAARKAFEFFGRAPDTLGKMLVSAMPKPDTTPGAAVKRVYRMAAN